VKYDRKVIKTVGPSDSFLTKNRRGRVLRRWFVCLLGMIAGVAAASPVHGAETRRAKRVLIISTGSRFSVGFPMIEQSAIERLRQLRPGEIEFYGESLDIIRFPSESYHRIFRDYLRNKYADDVPDLIILFYVGNLRVAEKNLGQLFPDTPIVAAGLTEEKFPPGPLGGRMTAIAQSTDPDGTIELILRLQPKIQRIVVIGGTAEVDRQVMSRARAAAGRFTGRVEFEFWDKRPMVEILKDAAVLPPQTAILFTRMFRDGAGRAILSASAAQSIAQTASVPLYAMTDSMFGTGAVGGSAADIALLGARAGELANGILSGADPKALPLEVLTQGTPIFDWRALQRWGISESRLPANSVVRFRPVSIWEYYKSYIIIGLIIILFQAAIIAALLVQRAQRRRAEVALVESRQFMELATEAGGIGLWVRDMVRGDLWANPRVRSLLGFGPDDRLGIENILARVQPEDRGKMIPVVARAQETGLPFDMEFRTAVPGAVERWIAARGQFFRGPQGQLLRRMGTMIDITERKQAEERLRQSEENFRRLVETTTAVLWQADSESWIFTYVAPQAVKLLGYPIEQWYEKDFWVSHIHPDDRERAVNTCLTMSQSAEEFNFEYRMMKMSGEVVWIDDFVSCQHRDGRPSQLRGFMLDVTERTRAEQAMRESEERFRTVANAAPVMIWMSDADKLCTFFNKGWYDFTGRTIDQELGHGWVEGVYQDDVKHCFDIYTQCFDARQKFSMEYRLRRADGEYRWVMDQGVPRFETDGGFLGYIGTCLDITEQKRGGEALDKERQFLRQVIDIDPNFIFAKDRAGRFTLANRALADAYGTTVENLIGKTDADFNPNAQETEFFQQIDRDVIDKLQEHFIPEERITDAEGKVRWLQTVKRPIVDADGLATQILGAATDITQRKLAEAELQHNRDELAHMTRVSTMGELAASLAHELNQPLTAILSNAQAAQRFMAAKPANLDEVREILKDIVQDDNRASQVIQKIRALVKKEDIAVAPLDLSNTINEVVQLLHSDAVLHNIGVTMESDPGLPRVRGDKVQLQQVMLNLLLNAFDAITHCPVNERTVAVQARMGGAGMVQVAVRDQGTGLSFDTLEKIFQPFYTSKRDGLGMGLSISRSIVEAHGGRLWAENNAGRGATFYFTVSAERSGEGQVAGGEGRLTSGG